MGDEHVHRVATYEQAERVIRAHDVIYLNDCFCRTPAKNGQTPWEWCGHPVETCLGFHAPRADEPELESREITQAQALEIFENWRADNGLFRFMEDEQWICCCCACGCMWFRDRDGRRTKDTCLKAPFIEKTDLDACTLCEDCVPACVFGARSIVDGGMRVDPEQCYGCSVCEHVCPEDAITMAARA
jgi:Pyruvate/2-oxoacid:ferredoxin oxidoreductase delta subunit